MCLTMVLLCRVALGVALTAVAWWLEPWLISREAVCVPPSCAQISRLTEMLVTFEPEGVGRRRLLQMSGSLVAPTVGISASLWILVVVEIQTCEF